jgi:hypothetical protein
MGARARTACSAPAPSCPACPPPAPPPVALAMRCSTGSKLTSHDLFCVCLRLRALLQCQKECTPNEGGLFLACGQCVSRFYCTPACQVPLLLPRQRACFCDCCCCSCGQPYSQRPLLPFRPSPLVLRLSLGVTHDVGVFWRGGEQSEHWRSTHYYECVELGELLGTCSHYARYECRLLAVAHIALALHLLACRHLLVRIIPVCAPSLPLATCVALAAQLECARALCWCRRILCRCRKALCRNRSRERLPSLRPSIAQRIPKRQRKRSNKLSRQVAVTKKLRAYER